MPSSGAKEALSALSETMSKAEVCAYVGKSKRTIDSYTATGRLRVGYFNGPNGKTGIFQRADVEALKRDLESPTYRAVVPAGSGGAAHPAGSNDTAHPDSMAVALRSGAVDPIAALAAHLARAFPFALRQPEPRKPWLTLPEAADYSGLPASYLLAQARAASIRAINVGTAKQQRWRFHRAALAK
jgi:hypothetical protein